ncbi:hypothetical protein CYY_001059 [Polysphondylium violaceum]|uniref:Ribokinase n=1 Tax=Polysphondylium violaceum TaxID=133409 RepID=A0A8J4UWJ3_9MYCE|nr:hypothetical protein CYY_001059 [Polysphondylium violaceum]
MNDRLITVVGGSNWDMFTYTKELPKAGETIKGTDFKTSFGGKASNQCVQAALLGSKCSIITKLSQDIFGQNILKNYKDHNVDCSNITIVPDVPSGIATIIVDSHGENEIIIVGGSNATFTTTDIDNAKPTIDKSLLLLCQLEIADEINLYALKLAKLNKKTKTILNPSPMPKDLNLVKELLEYVDILVVNKHEFNDLAAFDEQHKGNQNTDLKHMEEKSKSIFSRHTQLNVLIVTLGSKGQVLITRSNGCTMIESNINVVAVDTTGAGDSFLGSLAHYLVESSNEPEYTNQKWVDCIKKASKVAAISVTKYGTQTSYPSIKQVEDFKF